MMLRKFIHLLATLIIIGNLFLIGLVAYWLIKDYPVTYVEQPIEILNENNQIARGEPIVMKLNIVKNNNYSPSSSSTILCNDGSLFTLASRSVSLPDGEYTIISRSYILPDTVNVGATCKFKFTNNYKVNPIRTKSVVWESQDFKVIK